MSAKADTICAIATPPGRGGVGIIRLSGPDSFAIAERLYPPLPPPRQAALRSLVDQEGQVVDEGLILTFQAPHSFTGEDVVEIQAHGSPVTLELILFSLINAGAKMAEPGEFSKRAFLNNRIDLVQAEAIADLIAAETEGAARAAQQSLQGVFSKRIHDLVEDLTRLRVYVEASLDFPDEDVDFLADGQVVSQAKALLSRLETVFDQAKQGKRLNDGALVCLVGYPNAGKSSLLNRLSLSDAAIVTDIPGTTRDVVREHININGIPVTLADTAGLRETEDPVERMGIQRAMEEMEKADLIVWVIDGSEMEQQGIDIRSLGQADMLKALRKDYPALGDATQIIPVVNKVDATDHVGGLHGGVIYVSSLVGSGIDEFQGEIARHLGVGDDTKSLFSARSRHIEALGQAKEALSGGVDDIVQTGSGELLAESLREAAFALGQITGQISADELLGEIFSSFCIGK